MICMPHSTDYLGYILLLARKSGFESLERAFIENVSWFIEIKEESLFDSICNDPRFKVLLEKMGLGKV